VDNIKDIINQVIGKISSNKFESDEKIERVWRNILEEVELSHTKLDGIKDGKLSVCVDSSAWLYQMKMKKNRILERLKDEVPDVKNIGFRIGKIK